MKAIARLAIASAAFAALMVAASPSYAEPTSNAHTDAALVQKTTAAKVTNVSDAALVKSLPGFRNGYAEVNGVRLHYVVGGKGEPLVLLPGWPETWWAFHKIMPALAEHYTVIAVDLRGMGASSRPADGYDKKTMARDIYELVKSLGYDKASVAGHDIGSAVAFAYGENYPQATGKLVMMELPHPDDSLMSFPLLPAQGAFGDRLGTARPYLWWFAFNQVQGLPEKLLAGHIRVEQDWIFNYFLVDAGAVDARDRAVYERAYNTADAIRASNAWYQAFPQDVIDNKDYGTLQMPVLALGGPAYGWMKKVIGQKAANLTALNVENSGHFIQEEQPELVARTMVDFLQGDHP
ncbi:alpha/beta hydrolase [Paraburkholderia sp. BL10I2N1]|uniref:alpha/beta fold hydrolase n=1 Tax=Paraburkholderia sp. BL10I2N1 TaxID=1938796 RepID=UPI001AADBA91|nr:alpha/beta hydrolase [Paraburkholderia sp. BL10I2N1]